MSSSVHEQTSSFTRTSSEIHQRTSNTRTTSTIQRDENFGEHHYGEEHGQLDPEKVLEFRNEMGIIGDGPDAFEGKERDTTDDSIYGCVVRDKHRTQLQFSSMAIAVDTCLLLQIVFSTLITSTGAMHSSPKYIVVLGLANLIIAGLLWAARRPGIKMRLRANRQWARNLKEYIDLCERSFSQAECKLDVQEEVRKIHDMHDNAHDQYKGPEPEKVEPRRALYVDSGHFSSLTDTAVLASEYLVEDDEVLGPL